MRQAPPDDDDYCSPDVGAMDPFATHVPIPLQHLRLRSCPLVLPLSVAPRLGSLVGMRASLDGDMVMLLLLNSVKFVLMFLTCSSLGAAAMHGKPAQELTVF